MTTDSVMPVEDKALRKEFNIYYKWNGKLGFWYNVDLQNERNPVQIFQPIWNDPERKSWWVVSPNMMYFTEVSGENAEMRAFSIAAGYITQKK